MTVRILVTGSRNWDDCQAVYEAIDAYLAGVGAVDDLGYPTVPVVIVQGGCPTGADDHARRWARERGATIEPGWSADWKRYGRGAGPERNKAMVKAGADVCLVFACPCASAQCGPHWSHGTDDCMTRARAAGIEVRLFPSSVRDLLAVEAAEAERIAQEEAAGRREPPRRYRARPR